MRTSEMKLIGYCGVDSGQIMIIDPCYVLEEMDRSTADRVYLEICNLTCTSPFVNQWNDGVVTRTGWGDGEYPVYARIENERIMEVRIVFDDHEEE